MKDNEKVYTEATPRLIELHKNYKGNKAGDSDKAHWFDNCDNNNDTGCFYSEYWESADRSYIREGHKHLTEQEFIEFMGLEDHIKRVGSIEKAKETLDSFIKNGLPKELTAKLGEGKPCLDLCISRDNVNNPTHYTQGSIEPIDYITANNLNFLEGNVVKYVTRYKHKNGIEDLRKAEFYLKRLIKEYDNKGI